MRTPLPLGLGTSVNGISALQAGSDLIIWVNGRLFEVNLEVV